MQTTKETSISYDDIRVSNFERAIAKSRYVSFARYALWVLKKHEEGELIFYTKDLRFFAKISPPVAYNFMIDLVNLGYMEQFKPANNMVYFKLVANSTKPKLYELLPYITKTLKEHK